MLDVLRRIARPAESQKRDVVSGAGQIAQYVVHAGFWPGVERVGDELSEVEDTHGVEVFRDGQIRSQLW